MRISRLSRTSSQFSLLPVPSPVRLIDPEVFFLLLGSFLIATFSPVDPPTHPVEEERGYARDHDGPNQKRERLPQGQEETPAHQHQ
jgi:hypothetical protein